MAPALTEFVTRRPRLLAGAVAVLTLAVALLAGAPSLFPETFPGLAGVKVDTDPENMLRADEPVRVFSDRMKEVLSLHEMVVVGVVNDAHPQGVFNPDSLRRIHELTTFARTLRGAAIGVDDPQAGVVETEMIAPSLVDNIEQAGPGAVRFEWLMPEPPASQAEALALRDAALRIPFLRGTLVSEDGRAVALYLPLTSKDLSYRVYSRLREFVGGLDGDERYFITGLPVAEDTFGVEMFKQMAVSAPLAMLVIFLLLLYFFRNPVLIVSPMIVALATVIVTMGLLVATGNTIHIMSSMIPIFLMPIAVLDAVHILSEFFDRYPQIGDRRETIRQVMRDLFRPMLFTSLTSAAGFGSLALTPIPPVQVFGVFVAFGVLLAWALTITFLPAYVMFIPEARLAGFGSKHADDGAGGLAPALLRIGALTYRRAKTILVVALVCVAVAAYGISKIEINDNPTKWFRASHPIRVADRVLNEHFGGTYMAYLALVPGGEAPGASHAAPAEAVSPAERSSAAGAAPQLPAGLGGEPSLPAGLGGLDAAEPAGEPARTSAPEIFKQPDVLDYVARLQERLAATGVVGKSNSLVDIVKTVHRELIDGSDAAFRIPASAAGVAQTLVQYQSSHRPDDLWHFVTPDYRASSIWVQLRSGDNLDMERVVGSIGEFAAQNPPPDGLELRWFGLTYINVVWQEKMVSGMLQAFLGSFVVVLAMMILLFRSPVWGLLSMIPLTLTIGLIYGAIGLVGKDYDMPVAVLSSLTLGLAVDFAIHLLARARAIRGRYGTWKAAHPHVFGEPARAIARNVIVIAVGFLPLLAAPLRPYNTVGVLLAAILFISGLATLMLLPALLRLLEPWLFRSSKPPAPRLSRTRESPAERSS